MNHPDIFFLSFILIAIISIVALAEQDCVYTFKIQTGTRNDAGTDSVIGVIISDKTGQHIEILNLEKWGGIMGQGHNYNEKGNLDIYSANDRCLPSPVCLFGMIIDGSGNNPSWYVDYVEVTTAKVGFESKLQNFSVQQWLAIDEPPYEPSTVQDNCVWY